ncbi:hypothetical protein [Chondromyces crocatus]|uniref:Uncharacterized protein n=1 Tax=Chondromyces crocatus TaxID=52 RepID=A0A0K1EHA2_CHOCO|nr:hypothetical protein [Chondromyces crocatus]AKT40240.1 uncharacterized protein CMC5_043930 [Chondromyces crocatus]
MTRPGAPSVAPPWPLLSNTLGDAGGAVELRAPFPAITPPVLSVPVSVPRPAAFAPALRRSWNLRRSSDGETLVVTFHGKLTEADGRTSVLALVAQLARGPARVVWNLHEMTGYEAGARLAWQRGLWPVRHCIRSLEVIGGSPVVRVGAVTLTMVLGLEARFYSASRPPPAPDSSLPLEALGVASSAVNPALTASLTSPAPPATPALPATPARAASPARALIPASPASPARALNPVSVVSPASPASAGYMATMALTASPALMTSPALTARSANTTTSANPWVSSACPVSQRPTNHAPACQSPSTLRSCTDAGPSSRSGTPGPRPGRRKAA